MAKAKTPAQDVDDDDLANYKCRYNFNWEALQRLVQHLNETDYFVDDPRRTARVVLLANEDFRGIVMMDVLCRLLDGSLGEDD